jgi:tetratricopeptide (TPR) repeat protein
MTSYSVTRLDEIDEIDGGQNTFRPVRHHFGISTFGVSASTARSDGDLLVKEHAEAEPNSGEELYVVVSGRTRFELDGDVHEAPAGTLIHVPAGITRAAYAEEAGTTVLAIGGAPRGKPYEPSGWELSAPLFALYEAGDYAGAADRAQALLADEPPYGVLYYNAACFESRAGRTDAAIAHLRRAVELSPSLAELAREDDDLTELQEHHDFVAIVGS